MKSIISKVIDVLFSKIPFSKKNEELKEKLNQRMNLKYAESIEGENEIERVGHLISHCKNIESLCQFLDHQESDYDRYDEECKNQKDYKKMMRKLKKYNFFISLFIAFVIQLFISMICFFEVSSIPFYIIMIILYMTLVYIVRKKKKNYFLDKNYDSLKYDSLAKEYIYDLNDKYTKRLINTIAIDVSLLAYILLIMLLSILLSRYTYLDIIDQISYLSFIIELFIFFTIYHYLNKSLTDVYFTGNRKEKLHKSILSLLKYSSIYFIFIIFLMCIFRNTFSQIYNWIIVFWSIYFIAILVFNLTIRKDIVFKNLNRNIKRIVTISLILTCVSGYHFMSMDIFLTQPFINKVSRVLQQNDDISYNEENGVYTITTKKDDFKILQLTDIHLGGSFISYRKDLKSLQACYQLIKHTKPDFVVVTGDLVFPMGIMSFSLNNNAPIMQFANFMRNTGIPWAFTYGNHDTEGMATLNVNEFDDLMKSLSFKTSGNLLYPYIQPDIYGRSNQMIEIRHDDGKLMQALFLIDSNDYISTSTKINEYDYIHDDQVKWYEKNVLSLSKKEGYTIPSTLFFHIPLKEYITANDLYEKGSKEVKYYYGILGETMIDKICASKYDSKLFDTAVKLKSTKAMFFGHDHYNNQSLEYKGIRMTYGYSIDYLAMPGIEDDEEQRGATLITVDKSGRLKIEPYRLMDIQ